MMDVTGVGDVMSKAMWKNPPNVRENFNPGLAVSL
jgi:hypothetical protein